jgi:S1-C subfamily serine protease
MQSARLILAAAVFAALAPLRAQSIPSPTLLRPSADEAASPARRAGPAGLVASVRASVVHVVVEVDGPRGTFPIVRSSSGVIVGADGLVLTWLHLVREADGADDKRVFVQLDDAQNTRLPAVVEAKDAATGLALLRVKPASPLAVAPLADRLAMPGEPALVLSRPEGKEMLAFVGVASGAACGVSVGGAKFDAAQLFLCDSRNDERCDGAPVFDADGKVLGLYASEHVQRDVSEPTLEDLKKPSFGVVASAVAAKKAFGSKLGAAQGKASKPHAFAAAVGVASRSVVTVWAGDGEFPKAKQDDPGGVVRVEGLGSGVVLSASGLIVCNAHVARQGTPRIRTIDGKTFEAEVIDTNGPSNLALLKAKLTGGSKLVPIACNEDDDATVGEDVLAIGNPYGAIAVTKGVVSAKRDREGGRIQSDANLGNQNGGGAIIDAQGNLLGVGDAGPIDPIDMQFAQRGDRVSTETNLSTFVSIARLRRAFKKELEANAAATDSIREPKAADKSARATALSRMVEQHAGAMLNIYVSKDVTKVDEDDPFASMKERTFVPMSLGSGVVIDPSGLALSNWHVVDDATNPDGSMVQDHQVTARVFGGKEYRVKVLSISREDDLSLLQLELADGERLHAVELGDSESLAVGEPVAAIGNPHGRANTVTFGVVSAKDQSIRVKGRFEKLGPLVETDAAINGGNSGGALLDMNGRLVGINSAGGGTFNNKGYAIEVGHVRKQALGLLLQSYKLRSPDLGMRLVDDDGKVLVLDCDPRGPAHRAGMQSGDRIESLDGEAIAWSPAFALRMRNAVAGQEVAIEFERKGEKKTARIAPVAPEAWAVLRMSGLQTRTFAYADDEARMRNASIALHRAFTGDQNGEPQQVQESAVLVEKLFPGEQRAESDIAEGDLVLAAELRTEGGDPVLRRVDGVASLRDLWNDRELGSYDGVQWTLWVSRGAEVKRVQATAKRLFW